jgi:hypothetical protein
MGGAYMSIQLLYKEPSGRMDPRSSIYGRHIAISDRSMQSMVEGYNNTWSRLVKVGPDRRRWICGAYLICHAPSRSIVVGLENSSVSGPDKTDRGTYKIGIMDEIDFRPLAVV